jgi:hypothetical protein
VGHHIISLHSFIRISCVGHHHLRGKSSFHPHHIEALIIVFTIAAFVGDFIFIIQFPSSKQLASLSTYFKPFNQL